MLSGIVLLSTFILDLALGLFVLLHDYRSRVNQVFFLFVACLGLWIFALFVRSNNPSNLVLWHNLTFTGPFLLPSVLLLFSTYFPTSVSLSRPRRLLIIFPGLIFFVLSFWAVRSVSADGVSDTTLIPTVVFPVFFFSFMGLAFAKFFRSYKTSSGVKRLQVQYFLLGIFAMTIVASVTNLVLPAVFGIVSFNKIGPFSTLLMFGATAYAIVRHQLLDIRVVIKKSLIFSILVVVIAGAYSLMLVYLGNILNGILGDSSTIIVSVIVAFFIVLLYNPLYNFLERITDRFLFKGDYHSYTFLAELAKDLGKTLQVDHMVGVIDEGIDDVMRIESSALFLRESEDDKDFFLTRIHGWKRKEWSQLRSFELLTSMLGTSATLLDIRMLEDKYEDYERGKISEEQLGYNPKDIAHLRRYKALGVHLIVPLVGRNRLVGLLFVGEKKSGDVYRTKDLETLLSLAGQSAIAIVNAQLYQRVYQFNTRLKHEIDEATAQLEQQNRKLKRLDQTKSEFISIASHQLRTPLTSIKGYLSMIEDGDYGKVPEKLGEPLTRVHRSSERLVRLVEDLLDLSKIEKGKLQYKFEKLDLGEKLDGLCADFQSHAKKKGLELTCSIPKEPVYVSADRDKLHQVFQNLIDNSIKYTQEGSVDVSIQQTTSTVVVIVKDTGIGITEEDQGRIFQKFVRGNKMSLYHTGGSGIGLYLAKQVVSAHNGIIEALSEGEGKGSTFTVRLPLYESE